MKFSLLNFFFPPKCYLCNSLLDKEDGPLCSGCWDKLPLLDKPVKGGVFTDWVGAIVAYEGHVRQSMLRFKFHNLRHYGDWYGQLIGAMVRAKRDVAYDYVTWVPISRKRKRHRGYDQAQRIATAVAKSMDLPCQSVLRKHRHTRPQSTLKTAEERHANVMVVYQVRNRNLVSGKKILLIDDIWTTGATMNEGARMLWTAGAEAVDCAVFGAKRERS